MDILNTINSFVWGTPTLVLMLSAGALFSFGTGFFQIRHLPHWIRSTILSRSSNTTDDHSVSQRQAMSSALAATLGTGNIAGVSAALATGGAGAVFWMWISALFGMMTGYAENLLGTRYRHRSDSGEWRGGAMYYIRDGLATTPAKHAAKPLAVLFAVLCTLSAFGMGNMAQMNSAAGAVSSSFGIPHLFTGLVLAAVEAAIIFGGVKRVGIVTAGIVPLMSLFYILGAVWILAVNAPRLPDVMGAVFEGAFGLDAAGGGISGYIIKQAVSTGFRRGVFSNEAGLGTSVAAHAASDVREPCVQGMWSIFEVFFDTIVMCSLTAAILLASPCTAPTAEHAFSHITTEAQYFRLTDNDSIITDGAYKLVTGGEMQQLRTIYSTSFNAAVSQGEHTFSNIMTVRGIQATSSDGELLFLDSDKTVPLITDIEISEVNGSQLAAYAFSQTFGNAAGGLLAVAVVLFAFSTVIGWSCFGAQAVVFLFGERARLPFLVTFVAVSVVGAVMDFGAVWGLCDLFNGLMAYPNLIALFILSPQVFRMTNDYCSRTFVRQKNQAASCTAALPKK